MARVIRQTWFDTGLDREGEGRAAEVPVATGAAREQQEGGQCQGYFCHGRAFSLRTMLMVPLAASPTAMSWSTRATMVSWASWEREKTPRLTAQPTRPRQ